MLLRATLLLAAASSPVQAQISRRECMILVDQTVNQEVQAKRGIEAMLGALHEAADGDPTTREELEAALEVAAVLDQQATYAWDVIAATVVRLCRPKA